MPIRHALLGLLLRGGPQHGYELKSAFESELLPQSPLNFGQVYATLDRLERDSLVVHRVVSQEDRPDKKVFELTERGREELTRWINTPSTPVLDLRNEAFIKLALVGKLDGVDVAEVLAAERRAAFDQLHEVMRAKNEAATDGTDSPLVLLLDLAALRLEAFLKWLDRWEKTL